MGIGLPQDEAEKMEDGIIWNKNVQSQAAGNQCFER